MIRAMTPETIIHLITTYKSEFRLGLLEWDSSIGMTYDDNPKSEKSQAYDLGRTLGEAMNVYTGDYCDHIYDSYCDKCGIDLGE